MAPADDVIEVQSSRLWATFHFNLTRWLFPARMIADHIGVSTNIIGFWLTPWKRVDEIILFHRLKREQMGRIVEIQLTSLQKLLEDRKITLTLDAKARDWLAEKGYDPAYGARPLKRVIQKSVQDPLAELILSGKIKDGEKVAVSAGKDGLVFNGAKVAAAA